MTVAIGIALLSVGLTIALVAAVLHRRTGGQDWAFLGAPGWALGIIGIVWLIAVFTADAPMTCPSDQQVIKIPRIGSTDYNRVCATTDQALKAIGK